MRGTSQYSNEMSALSFEAILFLVVTIDKAGLLEVPLKQGGLISSPSRAIFWRYVETVQLNNVLEFGSDPTILLGTLSQRTRNGAYFAQPSCITMGHPRALGKLQRVHHRAPSKP